jgi:hypothetical protein
MKRWMMLLLLVPWVAGCPSTTTGADDGGTDAGGADVGADEVDAGATDLDGDGLAADRDCDDTDAAVGLSGSRTCAGPCAPRRPSLRRWRMAQLCGLDRLSLCH